MCLPLAKSVYTAGYRHDDAGVAADAPVSREPDEDRAAVLEAIHRFGTAVDSGDFAGVEQSSLDDFVFFGSGAGEESVGPADFAHMMTGLRDGVVGHAVDWELTMKDDYSVSIRGDAAVVTGNGRFRLRLTNATRSGRYLLTYVLYRTEVGWKVWAYHGSEPQPW
jgi:ketosteroid isomerase-like protein